VSLSWLQVLEADHPVQMSATKYGSSLCFLSTYKCATEMESAGRQVSELLVAYIVLHNWRETNIKYCIGYGKTYPYVCY
jgi:hypothetical protein